MWDILYYHIQYWKIFIKLVTTSWWSKNIKYQYNSNLLLYYEGKENILL